MNDVRPYEMTFFKNINLAGEHKGFVDGVVGQLEAIYTHPEVLQSNYFALLGHPHPLQQGTMNNKVVTTLARTFKELHIPSLRFNFRGVGQSEGQYDKALGESDDMIKIAKVILKDKPNKQLIFAGFSFGSYVAYRAAMQLSYAQLILVAPPVHHFNFDAFPNPTRPWVIVQGEDDDVVPLQTVLDFIKKQSFSIKLLQFDNTGHFFHGRLIDLKERLKAVMEL